MILLKNIIVSIYQYLKKNLKKSHLIIIGVGLFFILTGLLSWSFYFSKIYIFEKNEELFLEAVKQYYVENPLYLPKENLIRTTTLADLYEGARLDALTVPKSTKLCDENSWVKVYNDNGEYFYHVYLSCGKYESKTDHEGPEIILNGDHTVYINLGREYEELGVKEVKDKKDGTLDLSKVIIDSSRVNTNKVGTYEVTYTARDTLNNQTKITRTVMVVRNLAETVIDQTDATNYYKGRDVNNNYVLFSGMMFRIIGIKEDGTVLIISDELLNNLRINSSEYENSNIDQFLTNYFLPRIHSQDNIVDASYCVGEISSLEDISNSCNKTITRKVALLSVDEYQKTFENGNSFLADVFTYSLSNYLAGNNVNAYNSGINGLITFENNDSSLVAIKPVMTLKKDMVILTGNGTKASPYKLNDYSYGKQQDEIKTRLVGEYVNYSGMVFRIIDQVDGNTQLIAIDGFQRNVSDTTSTFFLNLVIPDSNNYKFNTKEESNPGYLLNNDYLDYISSNSIISTEYEMPTNEVGKTYQEYSKEKIKAKMILPKTYDLFSAVQQNNSGTMYLYLDYSLKEKNAFNVNINNGVVFEDIINRYGPYCFKPVITIEGNLKIRSGNGTINHPYYVNS